MPGRLSLRYESKLADMWMGAYSEIDTDKHPTHNDVWLIFGPLWGLLWLNVALSFPGQWVSLIAALLIPFGLLMGWPCYPVHVRWYLLRPGYPMTMRVYTQAGHMVYSDIIGYRTDMYLHAQEMRPIVIPDSQGGMSEYSVLSTKIERKETPDNDPADWYLTVVIFEAAAEQHPGRRSRRFRNWRSYTTTIKARQKDHRA